MNSATAPSEQRELLLIELNEFNPDLLRSAADALGLENIKSVLRFSHARTNTGDKIEHHGLDPWVQWVGVHCGAPTQDHNVRRLGETRTQKRPQIWETVSSLGNSWGVWGVMNAPRGSAPLCSFFMPDPWSYDERAYPEELNNFLALPRYVAQHYLELHAFPLMRNGLRLIGCLLRPKYWRASAEFLKAAIGSISKTGGSVHTFTTLLDYLAVLVFLELRKTTNPAFSLIFLNHIAHLQHHFWLAGDRLHPEMKVGLQLCDRMLGLLLANRKPGEAVLIMNGLKQVNVEHRGFHVYRQRDPENFLRVLGIEGVRVEQGMTHDAHLFFETADQAERGYETLNKCVLSDGVKAFFVERAGDTELFYQIDFEHRVNEGTLLTSGEATVPFESVVELVAERTGAHIPEGDAYFDGISIPDGIDNHQIFHVVEGYFSGLPPGIHKPRELSADAVG